MWRIKTAHQALHCSFSRITALVHYDGHKPIVDYPNWRPAILSMMHSDNPSRSHSSSRAAQHSAPARPQPRHTTKEPCPPTPVGVDPAQLIGKALKGVRRSHNHPNVTLQFTDNTAFQILVDGYDPRHRGVPKYIETDPDLEPIFNHPDDLRDGPLTICNAARITLADKAFDLNGRGSRWDQTHCGIALKFKEDGRWHCIWAMLAEYEHHGQMNCIFRSYHDVYLAALAPLPGRGKRRPPNKTQDFNKK